MASAPEPPSYNAEWDTGYGITMSSAPPEEDIELLPVKGKENTGKGIHYPEEPSTPSLGPPPAYPGPTLQNAATLTASQTQGGEQNASSSTSSSEPTKLTLIDREDYPGEIVLGDFQSDATSKPVKVACFKRGWILGIIFQVGTYFWAVMFTWQQWEFSKHQKYKEEDHYYYTEPTDHFNRKLYYASVALLVIFYVCMFLESLCSASIEYAEFKFSRSQTMEKVNNVRRTIPKMEWQSKSYHLVWKTIERDGETFRKEVKEVTHMETHAVNFKEVIDASPRFVLGKFSKGDCVRWTFTKSYAFVDRSCKEEYKRQFEAFKARNAGFDKNIDCTETFSISEPYEEQSTVHWVDSKPWWSAVFSLSTYYFMTLLSCNMIYRIVYSCKSKKYTYTFLKVLKI